MTDQAVSERARMLRTVSIAILIFIANGCGVAKTSAEIFASLGPARDLGGERFEADFFFAASSDRIGDRIELLNFDIFNSTINDTPLADYTRMSLELAPGFENWQGDQRFGQSSGFFASVVTLTGFGGDAEPYTLVDSNEFRVSTFVFDYSGLGLQVGDSVTLDLSGRPDGSDTLTSAIGINSAETGQTENLDLTFTTNDGVSSSQTTFTIATAIPEPASTLVLALAGACIACTRGSRASMGGGTRR